MLSIPELYDYSSKVRRRFANKLSELPWEKVIQNREASFYSMRNILVHMIDNEDWIVNWGINNESTEYKRLKEADEYSEMKQVIDHLDRVEAKTKAYISSVTGKEDQEFVRRVTFTLRSGKSYDLSVEELLFQSFTEQLYHLGELIALLWQENIEPPVMQWFNNNPRQQ
ncbi:MAG TPA: DinB family protein [Nitrososphaerales archaeon]|nr:DinB family protein [Nitrososphaerales archaeon]